MRRLLPPPKQLRRRADHLPQTNPATADTCVLGVALNSPAQRKKSSALVATTKLVLFSGVPRRIAARTRRLGSGKKRSLTIAWNPATILRLNSRKSGSAKKAHTADSTLGCTPMAAPRGAAMGVFGSSFAQPIASGPLSSANAHVGDQVNSDRHRRVPVQHIRSPNWLRFGVCPAETAGTQRRLLSGRVGVFDREQEDDHCCGERPGSRERGGLTEKSPALCRQCGCGKRRI